jgi:hypothetical protein
MHSCKLVSAKHQFYSWLLVQVEGSMLRQRMLPRFVLIAALLLTLCAGCQAREQLEQPNSATAALSKPDAAPNSVMFDSSPDIWQAVNQAVPMLVPYEHADQQNRHLLVDTKPDPYTTPPETVLFDDLLSDSSADLLPTDSRVAKKGAGCDVPNQVHLTYWSPTSVLVSAICKLAVCWACTHRWQRLQQLLCCAGQVAAQQADLQVLLGPWHGWTLSGNASVRPARQCLLLRQPNAESCRCHG